MTEMFNTKKKKKKNFWLWLFDGTRRVPTNKISFVWCSRNLLLVVFPHQKCIKCSQCGGEKIIKADPRYTVVAGAYGGAKVKLWCLHIFTSSASFSSDHCDLPQWTLSQHFEGLPLSAC